MNKLKVFKNELFEVSAKNENGEILFDVEQVAKCLGITETKNDKQYVMWRRVNQYIKPFGISAENSPQVAKGDLIPEPLVYKLAFKAQNDVAEKFQDWLAIEVIPQIRKTGSYQQPKTQLEILQASINQLVEQEKQILEIKSEQETIKHRLDNIDKVDTIGDLQQRLNAMVRRYAQQKGIAFGNAWKDFRQAYNTAYRTNLKMRMNNYKEKHGLSKLTMPQYFSLTNSLQDAIRVADKLLNERDAI